MFRNITSIHISSDSNDLIWNSKKLHNPRGSSNITYDLGNNRIHGVIMNINYVNKVYYTLSMFSDFCLHINKWTFKHLVYSDNFITYSIIATIGRHKVLHVTLYINISKNQFDDIKIWIGHLKNNPYIMIFTFTWLTNHRLSTTLLWNLIKEITLNWLPIVTSTCIYQY